MNMRLMRGRRRAGAPLAIAPSPTHGDLPLAQGTRQTTHQHGEGRQRRADTEGRYSRLGRYINLGRCTGWLGIAGEGGLERMAQNQPGSGLSWEEQQMQLAMALSLGMQQTDTPAASPQTASIPESSVSAADVTAALASVTSPSAAASAGESAGLTQAKLEAALAAATAATGAAAAVQADSGGAVRPRSGGTTLEPAVAATIKTIFDGITFGESTMDRDELERAVKRRATQQAGDAALEYLASAHARATEDGVEASATVVAVETVATVVRGLLAE
eukprot:COSAG02_NODE_10968_length_1822_cov_1.257690_1_plen_274_part_10